MSAKITMTEEGEASRSNGRKCTQCVRFDTCLIWRSHAIAEKSIEDQLGQKSCKIERHAEICDFYVPLSQVIGTK